MKYKIKSSMNKQAIKHLEMDKHDWVLFSGTEIDNCVQIAELFRMKPCDINHSNIIDRNGNYFRLEQLTFQSKKAAVRFVRKYKDWIKEAYLSHGGGCRIAMATQWHGKGCFYISLE